MNRLTLALMSALLAAETGSPGRVNFAELEGTYLSSIDGGCSLELRRDGSFTVYTSKVARRTGQAVPFGNGFLIVPISEIRRRLSVPPHSEDPGILEPPAAPASNAPSWPPVLRDPTRGPYVMPEPLRDESEFKEIWWLVPLRWGGRQYLIRNGDYQSFCAQIPSGVEPRRTAAGDQFLRRGDHRRRADRKPPKECASRSTTAGP